MKKMKIGIRFMFSPIPNTGRVLFFFMALLYRSFINE